MSDQDIFENENTSNKEETPPAQNDLFADQLKEIVNEEGKQKYDSVETALKALKASQDYIKELKSKIDMTASEKQQLEAQLEKMGNIEDFVNRVKPAAKTEDDKEATPPKSEGLSEEKVAELIQKQLERQKSASEQENNLAAVQNKLLEKLGSREKAAEHIQKKAKELGTTAQALKELAKTNPNLVMAALDGSEVDSAPSRNSISSSNTINKENPKPEFEKGVARGGFSDRQLAERWKEVGAYTYKRLGVESLK